MQSEQMHNLHILKSILWMYFLFHVFFEISWLKNVCLYCPLHTHERIVNIISYYINIVHSKQCVSIHTQALSPPAVCFPSTIESRVYCDRTAQNRVTDVFTIRCKGVLVGPLADIFSHSPLLT